MLELWKPCPGFSFYEVSSIGRMRSLNKKVTHKNKHGVCTYTKKGRVLKPFLGRKDEYWTYTLHENDGTQRSVMAHRMVCLAFNGEPPPDKPLALHEDGVPTHNWADNLYWGTHKDNSEDMVKHGRSLKREKHHKTVLTLKQVADIKARYTPKHPANGSYAMAKEFGVHRTTIENIVAGRSWKP
jgi:hypothetical protein